MKRNPKKGIVGLLAALSLLGCSFKESAVDRLAQSQDVFYKAQVLINWNSAATPVGPKTDEANDLQSGVRSLVIAGSELIRTLEPITLPPTVPKCVYAEVRLRNQKDFSDTLFTRSRSVRDDGSVQNLVSEVVLPTFPGRFTIQICGLAVHFSNTQSASSNLLIDLYSSNLKLATFQIGIRTPPSRLETEELSLSEWLGQSDVVQPESWLHSDSSKGPIHLLKVLKIQNSESAVTEIQIPKTISGVVTQWTNPIVHKDHGCSATADESPTVLQLTEALRAIPMDSDFGLHAWDIDMPGDSVDRFHITVKPAEVYYVGVYGSGPGISSWAVDGPKVPELSPITVPGNCFHRCTKFYPCGRFDPGCESERPCAQWADGRDPVELTVGVNRGPVLLQLEDVSRNWETRFSDVTLNQDRITRNMTFLQAGKELGWVH